MFNRSYFFKLCQSEDGKTKILQREKFSELFRGLFMQLITRAIHESPKFTNEVLKKHVEELNNIAKD